MLSYKMSLILGFGLCYLLSPSSKNTGYQTSHDYHQPTADYLYQPPQGSLGLQLCDFRQRKRYLVTLKLMSQWSNVSWIVWGPIRGLWHYLSYHTSFKSWRLIIMISMQNPLLYFIKNSFTYLITKWALPAVIFLPPNLELI